jgi:hypothetical protein
MKPTPVRNQGACNSGYAHSVIDVINMQNLFRIPKAEFFSVQYIIDCSKYFGPNNGCLGGSAFFSYLFNGYRGAIS